MSKTPTLNLFKIFLNFILKTFKFSKTMLFLQQIKPKFQNNASQNTKILSIMVSIFDTLISNS